MIRYGEIKMKTALEYRILICALAEYCENRQPGFHSVIMAQAMLSELQEEFSELPQAGELS